MATDYSSKDVAEKYAEVPLPSSVTLGPVMLEIVGDVHDKHIVDFGCGNGYFSILFAAKGAHVVAIDRSQEQIAIAQTKNAHPNITYKGGDVAGEGLADESMDIVFANLVVPDLAHAEELKNFFALARRIVKENGRFIFSILHPFYLVSQGGMADITTDFESQNYFNEGTTYRAETLTNAGNKIQFTETHFSLSFTSKLLKDYFFIQSLTESKQLPEKGILLPITQVPRH
jgi:2-polyprenyl-3-methyl-5-hydroxy-6-metoxy-1,4-benzoquinol methylase